MPRLVLQACGVEARLDGAEHPLADLEVPLRDPGRRGAGGVLEVPGLHAVAGGMNVDVARLQSA